MSDEPIVDMACDPSRETALPEDNPYPYGLRISLNAECLEKLGITELPELGSKCAFYICGEVVSTAESSEYGESKCMGVQIQQMGIEELPEGEEEERSAAEQYSEKANKLYGKSGAK